MFHKLQYVMLVIFFPQLNCVQLGNNGREQARACKSLQRHGVVRWGCRYTSDVGDASLFLSCKCLQDQEKQEVLLELLFSANLNYVIIFQKTSLEVNLIEKSFCFITASSRSQRLSFLSLKEIENHRTRKSIPLLCDLCKY